MQITTFLAQIPEARERERERESTMEPIDMTRPGTRHRRAVVRTAYRPPPPEDETKLVGLEYGDGDDDALFFVSKPAGWLIHAVTSQVDAAAGSLASLSSAFLSLFSDSRASAEVAPSRVAHGGGALLRKFGFGVLGAAYACFVLLAALVLAVVIGVGLVRVWVEEPVSLRRPLYFDYTEENPSAVVGLVGGGGYKGRAARAVPLGHTFVVSLELMLPESHHNREIGNFQVAAEVIGSTGEILASSSQPCMLRFRSTPVRLMRTFVMGVPLVLGISCETQRIAMEVLRYKEGDVRTEAIKIALMPRAGTFDLPQLYEAELLMKSQLPWRKELAYNWKWTFYVWVSLYVYVMLLLLLLCCFRPFAFPGRRGLRAREPEGEEAAARGVARDDKEISDEFADALRKWRTRSRRKRKVTAGYRPLVAEDMEGSGSSVAAGEVVDDPGEFPASESSECVGG